MEDSNLPAESVDVINEEISVSVPAVQPASAAKVCFSCRNLLQNPSFETGLTGWESDNVTIVDPNAFEGTQEARLGPGVASLFQDVSLTGLSNSPLFLSFEAAAAPGIIVSDLVAEVVWLDAALNPIGTGLRLLIPEGVISSTRPTFFEITDQPPVSAIWARLQFSKTAPGALTIDQVILTPVGSINLLQNPGFQLGLIGWTATNTTPSFSFPFEGTGKAEMGVATSTLFQDVPISRLPSKTSFLLSFAARSEGAANLSVRVLWLDAANNQIGSPGLALSIQAALPLQSNYLTYLDLTQQVPSGAVTARILFTYNTGGDLGVDIDKVIFAVAGSANQIQNPSFEMGLNAWNFVNTTPENTNDAYEGSAVARIPGEGGALFQDVPIKNLSGQCLLLNFGYRRSGANPIGNTLAEVRWLNSNGREIGLGLSLFIPSGVTENTVWLVYTGITEPAPQEAAQARVQFSKSSGETEGYIDIDKVVLGRLV